MHRKGAQRWYPPILAFALTLALAWIASMLVEASIQQRQKQVMQTALDAYVAEAADLFDLRMRRFMRMLQRAAVRGGGGAQGGNGEGDGTFNWLIEDYPSLRAIELKYDSGRVRSFGEAMPTRRVFDEPALTRTGVDREWRWDEQAIDGIHWAQLSKDIGLADGSRLLMIVRADQGALLQYLLAGSSEKFSVRIHSDAGTLYQRGESPSQDAGLEATQSRSIAGRSLTMTARAGEEWAAAKSSIRRSVFGLSAVMSLLCAAAVGLATGLLQQSRRLRFASATVDQEINERRSVQEALTRARREADTALNAINDGFIVYDNEWRFRYINASAVKTAGLSANDLIGRSLWEAYPELIGTEFERLYRSAQSEQKLVQFEYHSVPSDQWLEIRIFPEETRTIAILRDISEERRALAQMQARDLLYQLSTEIFCLVDRNGCFVQVNPAVGDLIGREESQLIGRTWTDFVSQEDRALALAMSDRLHAEGSARPIVLRFLREGEEPAWIELSANIDADGTMFIVGRDIGARLQSERALVEALRQVETRNIELEDFAFVASHDLQEPLRKIRTYGAMLNDRSSEALGESGRGNLLKMTQAAERMSQLIEALLTYSRTGSEGQHFTPLPLGEVVAAVVDDLESGIADTGASIAVHDLPEIDGDRSQLTHMFLNLIGNALKFVVEGEKPLIDISAETFDKEEAGIRRAWCRLYVRDHGIGFDQRHADRIFAPFTRLHGRDRYPGSGIGLSIVRRVVQRHNGSISTRAAIGGGTCFIVELPIRQASREPLNKVGASKAP